MLQSWGAGLVKEKRSDWEVDFCGDKLDLRLLSRASWEDKDWLGAERTRGEEDTGWGKGKRKKEGSEG